MRLQCPICTELDEKKLHYTIDLDRTTKIHVFQCDSCSSCITNNEWSEWDFINSLRPSVPSRTEHWRDYEDN